MLNALLPLTGGDLVGLMPWIVERCNLPGIDSRLSEGRAGAYIIAGTEAALILSVGITETGAKGLWVISLGGRARGGAKRNARLMRAALEDVAEIGRASDCKEIRIEAGTRTMLKLRLFSRLGFETATIGNFIVMRKAL